MTIAFGAQGLTSTSTGTTVTCPFPTGITAGQLLVLAIANKYPSAAPTTPTGWTLAGQYSGGSGVSGVDAGSVYISLYTKVAVGTESSDPDLVVQIPSGNSASGRISRYTGDGTGWGLAVTGGSFNTPSTAWSVTTPDVLDIVGGDLIIAASGVNSDGQTFTVENMTATGLVFGTMTERTDVGSASGDDCALLVTDHPVTSGTATAAPIYTATASATATDCPAGATLVLRLRETGLAFGGIGTRSAGSTTSAPACPATVNAGDLLILAVCNKYPTNGPATPSGWLLAGQYSGGAGASGADAGQVYITVFTRLADGTEAGTTVNVSISSGNSNRTQIFRYRKDAGLVWELAVAGGSDSTAGVDWSVTASTDPGIVADDILLALSASNTDVATVSGHAMTATGITFATATEREDQVTNLGDDVGLFMAGARATAGTSSAAPVYTATHSSSLTNGPAGATLFLRLRQASTSMVGTAAGSSTATGVGAATAATVAAAAGTSTVAGVGASLAAAAGSSAGVASVTGVGAANAETTGSSAGSSTAAGVGASTAVAVGSSTASSTATGIGEATSASVGTATGSATAAGVAASIAEAVAASSGAATVAGVGSATVATVGSAAGSATVAGVGTFDFTAEGETVGFAAGTCVVLGVGAATAETVGTAAGTSTVTGRSTAALARRLTGIVNSSAGRLRGEVSG